MAAEPSALVRAFIAAALLSGGCGDAASDTDPDAAAASDAATERDAGYAPPEVMPPEADAGTEFWLSQTGLYVDIAKKQLAPDLIEFEPEHALWSDGAGKARWLRLPAGTRVDSSDPDHWQFPVGSMLFKEFAREDRRLETRLIMRTGSGPHDYFMGAFAWNDDESDALYVEEGAANVRGTNHDVPARSKCLVCHDGEPGRVLGFSAVQQPAVDAALLSEAPAATFTTPGDALTARALGYLHANCGHCHNENGSAWPDTDMDLRLRVSDRAPEQTAAYRSTVGVPLQYFDDSPLELRVAPGDATQSGVHYRMSVRGPKTQMPPIATEHVDDTGLEAVRAWIDQL